MGRRIKAFRWVKHGSILGPNILLSPATNKLIIYVASAVILFTLLQEI